MISKYDRELHSVGLLAICNFFFRREREGERDFFHPTYITAAKQSSMLMRNFRERERDNFVTFKRKIVDLVCFADEKISNSKSRIKIIDLEISQNGVQTHLHSHKS